jgi:hypothetical protein
VYKEVAAMAIFRGARAASTHFFRPQIEALEGRTVRDGVPGPIAMHIHVHLSILIDGQLQTVPANIGRQPDGTFLFVHTHDTSGLIHIESPVVRPFELHEFFDNWGVPFSSQRILGYQVDATHPVTMTVNGQPSGAYGALVLHDHDDIVIVADDATPAGPGPSPANYGFVVQLYRDLMRREVDHAALAYFSTALDQGTLTRWQVVTTLEGSAEYEAGVVTRLYAGLLQRPPDPVGLQQGVAFLQNGGTREQLLAAVVGSPEYFQKRGGGTAAGYVNALYQDALGRDADAAGLAYWVRFLAAGGDRTAVAAAVLASDEFRGPVVDDFYQTYLHRPADGGSRALLLQAWRQGESGEQIAATLLASDEYFVRAAGS